MERVFQGHFSPEDRERDEFPLIPFEVPPGVVRLSVAYEFSRPLSADKAGWEEGNILDIGLFDPRGAEFPNGRGFRGWSGSARREFTLSAAARPHPSRYLAHPAGPLPTGPRGVRLPYHHPAGTG